MLIATTWRSWRVTVLTVLASLVLYLLLWFSWGGGAVYLMKLATLTPSDMAIYLRLAASSRVDEPLFFEAASTLVNEPVSSRFDAAVKLTYVESEATGRIEFYVQVQPLTSDVSFETSCSISQGDLQNTNRGYWNEDDSYVQAVIQQRNISTFRSYNMTADKELIDRIMFLDQNEGIIEFCTGFYLGMTFLHKQSPELLTEPSRLYLAQWLSSPLIVRISYSNGGIQRFSEYVHCQVEIDDASYEWLLQMGVPLDDDLQMLEAQVPIQMKG